MIVEKLGLEGAIQIKPKIHTDHRGFFFEWFNQEEFNTETGIRFNPVQFNYSRSNKGVLRGLHFQNEPHAQAKIISVTKGLIQDVVVDLRIDSATFGQSCSLHLSAEHRNQIYIPKGFAHGFLVLSEEAEIFYAIDDFYSPKQENGILYNDPKLKIDWEIIENKIILSDKDKAYKTLTETHINVKLND